MIEISPRRCWQSTPRKQDSALCQYTNLGKPQIQRVDRKFRGQFPHLPQDDFRAPIARRRWNLFPHSTSKMQLWASGPSRPSTPRSQYRSGKGRWARVSGNWVRGIVKVGPTRGGRVNELLGCAASFQTRIRRRRIRHRRISHRRIRHRVSVRLGMLHHKRYYSPHFHLTARFDAYRIALWRTHLRREARQ